MVDTILPEQRSRLMSRVRGRDTGPEMHVRRTVWGAGFRYRLHARKLPGTPDLVLAKYRLVVFVHGCFWHQHGCARSRRPSSNQAYWERKLDANIDRDSRYQAELEKLGWTVVVIWECRLDEDTKHLLSQLEGFRERQ